MIHEGGPRSLESLFMNLVRRKRLPRRRSLGLGTGHRAEIRESQERRSTDFKSIRKPDKIFYGERALMALTTKGPPWPHWFVVTEDDSPYRLAPCPSSADPFPQRDCDIAQPRPWNLEEFRNFNRSLNRGIRAYNALTRLKYFFPCIFSRNDTILIRNSTCANSNLFRIIFYF